MIKHLLLLTFLSVFLVVGAQAQLKFGVAAGYEHLSSTTSRDIKSSGGIAGSLLFSYSLAPHWEMDLTPTFAAWKSSFRYYITFPPLYGYGAGLSRPVDVSVAVIHVTAPLYICYVHPMEDHSVFFGGPGLFWSSTSMTGGEQSPILRCIGLSLLAGIREEHWQFTIEYRPWFNDYSQSHGQFDGHLSNDLSLKIGYTF